MVAEYLCSLVKQHTLETYKVFISCFQFNVCTARYTAALPSRDASVNAVGRCTLSSTDPPTPRLIG
jgi:hypothetical protein